MKLSMRYVFCIFVVIKDIVSRKEERYEFAVSLGKIREERIKCKEAF